MREVFFCPAPLYAASIARQGAVRYDRGMRKEVKMIQPEKTGTLIAALRHEHGLTQRQLAERLHISDKTVSKWERGGSLR